MNENVVQNLVTKKDQYWRVFARLLQKYVKLISLLMGQDSTVRTAENIKAITASERERIYQY